MSKQTQKQTEEFKNFRALTEKLVAVPKKEIDQKKAAYEQKKKEKPAK
jgi:hypothetical protein